MTRIVAGEARGRRLSVPGAARPTGDRAREGVFSSLVSLLDLEGLRVLDLYAGSGALGLEALSRGAASVTLVDSDAHAAVVLQRNADAVGLPGALVVHRGVDRFLAESGATGAGGDSGAGAPAGTYDLVFLDPPYDQATVPLRELRPLLAVDAVVVVERRARDAALEWPEGYEAIRHRRYGEAMLWIGGSV